MLQNGKEAPKQNWQEKPLNLRFLLKLFICEFEMPHSQLDWNICTCAWYLHLPWMDSMNGESRRLILFILQCVGGKLSRYGDVKVSDSIIRANQVNISALISILRHFVGDSMKLWFRGLLSWRASFLVAFQANYIDFSRYYFKKRCFSMKTWKNVEIWYVLLLILHFKYSKKPYVRKKTPI